MNVVMADFYWLNAAISLSVFGYYLYRLGRGSFKGTRPVFRALTIVMLLLFFYTLYLAVRNSSPLGFVSTEVITSLNEPGAKWLFSGALITLGCIGLFFLGRRLEPVEDEMAMSVLHRRYRYMIEGDPRAILMFQHDRTLAEVNRQGSNWLSGTPEELRGLSVESVLDRLGFDEPEVVFERVLLKRSVEVKTEERILGDFEWSDLHCDKGNLLGSMLCFRDVTADKKFQREIIQSEKLAVVGQLAAATAHEIRNPLTSIKGFLQLLEHRMEREGQQGETREYTRIMVEEVDRMEKIIRDFLLMTKPSDVTREIGSLNAVLERVLVLIQNQAILRNIHVITELGDLPQVPMHKEAIQQVVLNLTQNALEAMNIGGTLTLHTFVEDSYIAIRVQDTGVGMTEEEVNNLGSPFYSTKTEGTGLGLTVSSKIIKEHGGEMQVESEKGKGTTITVRLPIA